MSCTWPGMSLRPNTYDKCTQPPLRNAEVGCVDETGTDAVTALPQLSDESAALGRLEKWCDVLHGDGAGFAAVTAAEDLQRESVARITSPGAVERGETLARRAGHEHVGVNPGEVDLTDVRGEHARVGEVHRERLGARRIVVDCENAAVSARSMEAESEPSSSTEQIHYAQVGHGLAIVADGTDGSAD